MGGFKQHNMDSKNKLYEIASVPEIEDEREDFGTYISSSQPLSAIEEPTERVMGYLCTICRKIAQDPVKNICAHYVCQKCEKPSLQSCNLCMQLFVIKYNVVAENQSSSHKLSV